MLNQVNLIGRLGQDPELRYTGSGKAVASLSVATSETWVKDGNKQEATEWHRVILWEKAAENAAKYLGKGSLVYVSGKITKRKYQDQNGMDREATEIQGREIKYLQHANQGGQQQQQQPQQGGYQQQQQQQPQQGGYQQQQQQPGGTPNLDQIPF